jgi:hypothetical protein
VGAPVCDAVVEGDGGLDFGGCREISVDETVF